MRAVLLGRGLGLGFDVVVVMRVVIGGGVGALLAVSFYMQVHSVE